MRREQVSLLISARLEEERGRGGGEGEEEKKKINFRAGEC